LHEELATMARKNQKCTEPPASTDGPQPVPQPSCSECGREREPPIAGPNDPIEVL